MERAASGQDPCLLDVLGRTCSSRLRSEQWHCLLDQMLLGLSLLAQRCHRLGGQRSQVGVLPSMLPTGLLSG